MERLWERVEGRRPTAVVGCLPATPHEYAVLRVSCEGSGARATVTRLREEVDRLLGGSSLLDTAADRLRTGLRRRLLGEPARTSPTGVVLEALHRLGQQASRPPLVVLEEVDRADDTTLSLLRRLVAGPDEVPVPLVLVFREEPPATATPRKLLDVLIRAHGDEAVIRLEPEQAPRPEAPAVPVQAMLVLRAAATVGPRFVVSQVARLLETDPLEVLSALQMARDAGVPVEDAGGGRMVIPDALVDVLRTTTLPSLRGVFDERLKEDGLARPAPPAPPPEDREPRKAEAPPRVEPTPPRPEKREEKRPSAQRRARDGGPDGVDRALAAAMQAAATGAHADALSYGRQALSLAESRPDTPENRLLRVRVLTELAHLQWAATAPGEGFTLADAMATAEEAKALVGDRTPAGIHAEVCQIIAGITYDLGDEASLRRALRELDQAARVLSASGAPIAAARLLNDQAAVWVRLGYPGRAGTLLRESRAVFEARAGADPDAAVEVAETDHLLGRLPLHLEAPVEDALRHARAAEQAYAKLRLGREQARVWETIGRLELRAGRIQEAGHVLERAAEWQQEAGDVLGLARTTEALAEVFAAAGRPAEAVALLSRSVDLNVEKGSPVGLAYLRRSLSQLVEGLSDEARAPLQQDLEAIASRLDRAQAIVGRVFLPPGT